MLIDSLDTTERTALVMAGFDSRTIDYQSAAQRFANSRQRLRADLASLIAYGLAEARVENRAVLYGLTPTGSAASISLTAAYADGLRQAISVVLPVLLRLSDRALRQQATEWLRVKSLDLDLLGLEPPCRRLPVDRRYPHPPTTAPRRGPHVQHQFSSG